MLRYVYRIRNNVSCRLGLAFSRVTFMSKNDTTYKICMLGGLQRQRVPQLILLQCLLKFRTHKLSICTDRNRSIYCNAFRGRRSAASNYRRYRWSYYRDELTSSTPTLRVLSQNYSVLSVSGPTKNRNNKEIRLNA